MFFNNYGACIFCLNEIRNIEKFDEISIKNVENLNASLRSERDEVYGRGRNGLIIFSPDLIEHFFAEYNVFSEVSISYLLHLQFAFKFKLVPSNYLPGGACAKNIKQHHPLWKYYEIDLLIVGAGDYASLLENTVHIGGHSDRLERWSTMLYWDAHAERREANLTGNGWSFSKWGQSSEIYRMLCSYAG